MRLMRSRVHGLARDRRSTGPPAELVESVTLAASSAWRPVIRCLHAERVTLRDSLRGVKVRRSLSNPAARIQAAGMDYEIRRARPRGLWIYLLRDGEHNASQTACSMTPLRIDEIRLRARPGHLHRDASLRLALERLAERAEATAAAGDRRCA